MLFLLNLQISDWKTESTKIGQKTREFPLLFFAKIFRNVRHFLTKLKIFIFFHFFTKDISKRLLWGPETISVIYWVVFEKWAKKKLVLTIPSVRQYESGQKAWEPGGVGEKATYRHTSRTLIPLGYPFFLTFDFLNMRFSDAPIFRCFEFQNFRFTKLLK